MLMKPENHQIYTAQKPVDFRMSIDGLSALVKQNPSLFLTDGSYYVFFNTALDKMKVLFWDGTGFVLVYKRLVNTKFKIKNLQEGISNISYEDFMKLVHGDSIQSDENVKKLKLMKKS
jgi:transposase